MPLVASPWIHVCERKQKHELKWPENQPDPFVNEKSIHLEELAF
jgi:hypothetical protein